MAVSPASAVRHWPICAIICLAFRAHIDTILGSAIEAADPALAAMAIRKLEGLTAMLHTGDLKQVDSDRLRALGEEFVVTLQSAAPAIGLKKPELESGAQ